jgi:hypothetical protein
MSDDGNLLMVYPSVMKKMQDEIQRLTKERDDARSRKADDFNETYKEGFADGASQMRERAALACDVEAPGWHEVTGNPCVRLGKTIRALPLEESK